MTWQPLSEVELDALSELLSSFDTEGTMNLEELDGYFAALLAGPDNVLPSEYLPELWGDATVNKVP
jgi:uncharacterized protein